MSELEERLREAGVRRITEAEDEWIDDHRGEVPYSWWEGHEPEGYVAFLVVPIDWAIPVDAE